MSLHWSTVTPEQRRLVEVSSSYVEKWNGCLAGGTAVALRLGHRRSVDLDFFTRSKLDADVLATDFRRIAKAARMGYELEEGNKKGSFGARVGQVSVSVLHGYSQTDEPEVSAGLYSIDELMSRHFRRSLTDFKLAEPTLMPRMLKTHGRSWPVIKRHLKKWASK